MASNNISIIGNKRANTIAKINCNASNVRYFHKFPRVQSVSADATAAITANTTGDCEETELYVNKAATRASPNGGLERGNGENASLHDLL